MTNDDLDFPDPSPIPEVGYRLISESDPRRQGVRVINTVVKRWAVVAPGIYRASEPVEKKLPPGVYSSAFDQAGNLLFIKKDMVMDEFVDLPDTAGSRVLESLALFWSAKQKFIDKKQIFKRGILLWGNGGGGKSVLIMQMTKELVRNDGVVFYVDNPDLATNLLSVFRRVEPERHLICILEDLDEMVARYGEHAILSLLDGDTQINNAAFIATTNYPEKLAKRIINRPSRFDEVIKIDMPSDSARRVYLRARLSEEEVSNDNIEKWVIDTKGLSIAHLRELVVCVYCLGREYDVTLRRLRRMDTVMNTSNDDKKVGF
jgi:predicted AAA+ superfamily ATPase